MKFVVVDGICRLMDVDMDDGRSFEAWLEMAKLTKFYRWDRNSGDYILMEGDYSHYVAGLFAGHNSWRLFEIRTDVARNTDWFVFRERSDQPDELVPIVAFSSGVVTTVVRIGEKIEVIIE